MPGGSLTVVGTGIGLGTQLTPEARASIEGADEFLHLAGERLTSQWLAGLHPRGRSLDAFYRSGVPRHVIYEEIVEAILAPVRAGARVCAAFYGHPGVFVRPSHEAVRRARAEGAEARMLPGVSAADCLFADLGVDPADAGCASYEATDFLVHRRIVDTSAALILWQISVIGELGAVTEPRLDNLAVLVDRLAEDYPLDHVATVYEASPYPVARPVIEPVALGRLASAALTPLSTLYVPPASARRFDAAAAERLGVDAR